MSHGNTIAYSDSGEYYGHTTCHGYAHFYSFCDLIQIHVSGYDLIEGADDTDHGASSLFFGKSQRIEQTSVGCLGSSCLNGITSHNYISLSLPYLLFLILSSLFSLYRINVLPGAKDIRFSLPEGLPSRYSRPVCNPQT